MGICNSCCCCDENEYGDDILKNINNIAKFKSIDDVDNYINNKNLIITANNIAVICTKKAPLNIILHLMSYKIIFDNNSVLSIMKSYDSYDSSYNNEIISILSAIRYYGYEFTSINFTTMLKMKNFYEIFNKFVFDPKYKNNLIIDDSFINNLNDIHYSSYYPVFFDFLDKICDFIINKNNLPNIKHLKQFCEKLQKLYYSENYKTNALKTKKKNIDRILNKFN